MDGQRGAPAAGAEDGDPLAVLLHGGAPASLRVSARRAGDTGAPSRRAAADVGAVAEQDQHAVPIAATNTGVGAPASHAAGGSVTVAATDPSDT